MFKLSKKYLNAVYKYASTLYVRMSIGNIYRLYIPTTVCTYGIL